MDINVTKKYIKILPNDWLAVDRAFNDIYKQVNSIIDADLAHNDLSSIQGGSATERYHLTEAQQGVLHDPATIGGYPLSISGQEISFGYNTTNLQLTANQLDTIQGISSAASPTFAGLTVTNILWYDLTNFNTIYGNNAGKYISQTGGGTKGQGNTFFGTTAGFGDVGGSTGYLNSAVGNNALNRYTTGYRNMAFGWGALYYLTTGHDNVGIGYGASYNGTDIYNDVAIGYNTLYTNIHGIDNVAIGTVAMTLATGSYNTAIGFGALRTMSTGENNTSIGCNSGHDLTEGLSNIFIGDSAGYNQTTLSNLLIIDNQNRTSVALEITNSLIYGVFDAVPANQTFRINAAITGTSFAGIGSGLTNVDAATLQTHNAAYFQVAGSYQPLATNLSSLAGLTFVSTSFVKMTSAGTFGLDTATYLTAEADTLATVMARGSTTGVQLTSTLAIGTSPFAITSTTVNTNLNADLWDGYQFSDYLDQSVKQTASPQFDGLIIANGSGGISITATEFTYTDLSKYGYGIYLRSNFNSNIFINGIDLGKQGNPNTAGYMKLWSAGITLYSTTFIAGTQTENINYTLPTAYPVSVSQVLQSTTAGVLSWVTPAASVSFGTTTQIPYMNAGGTDFLYSANLVFNGTNLTCLGTMGIGISADAAYGLSTNKTVAQNTTGGLNIMWTNSPTNTTGSLLYGLLFIADWKPISLTANRRLLNAFGCQGKVMVESEASSTYSGWIANAYNFYSNFQLTIGAGGATPYITSAYGYYATNAELTSPAYITNLYAFYDAGQTKGTNNWGFYGKSINNVIGAIAGGMLAIGKTTAPTVPLDVVGAGLFSTSGLNSISTLTLAGYNDQPTYGPELIISKSNSDTTDTLAETQNGDELGTILVKGVTSTPTAIVGFQIRVVQNGASGAGVVPADAYFETGTTVSINANQLVLKSVNGYVGIGTSDPSANLDVAGTCKFGSASTNALTCLGRLIVRSVNDKDMDATNGTVAEIVYNTQDSKFYGCIVSGDPATWSIFN